MKTSTFDVVPLDYSDARSMQHEAGVWFSFSSRRGEGRGRSGPGARWKPLTFAQCCLVLLACWCGVGAATAQTINWRVSVKFILDANGNRPADTSANKIATDPEVQAYIDYANRVVLPRSGRGYRMQLLLPIQEIRNASQWFNLDACDGLAGFETEVMNSFLSGANKYLFDPTAINIYVTGSRTAGCCSCAAGAFDIIAVSQDINPDWVLLHESGHYLGLPHTHDEEANYISLSPVPIPCAFTNPCVTCPILVPGNDGIADTLSDHSCWDSLDQIAQGNFNQNWANLDAGKQTQVDDLLHNVMSYHGSNPGDRDRLSSDQLDVMADYSNGVRSPIATGITWFVDRDNTAAVPLGNSKPVLSIGGPFPTVQQGVAVARANDIVLIRPGIYTGTTRFDKAMTLRATRGNATLRAN
jgi:hypothetical protein